ISINRSLRSASSQLRPWMEYCIAAASSPLAPPNCSSSMFPNLGSASSTRTVYISFFTWWYMSSPPAIVGLNYDHSLSRYEALDDQRPRSGGSLVNDHRDLIEVAELNSRLSPIAMRTCQRMVRDDPLQCSGRRCGR